MKKRNWATIIYPESVKEDYIETLEKTGLQIAISPLHDKDIYDKGEQKGQIKKAHKHILICYENTTTEKVVKELIDKIGGVGIEPVESKKGYYEYLTHKNNKDKAQYNEEDIIKLNNFNISDNEENKISHAQVEIYKREIIKIIRVNQIKEYRELIDYLIDNELEEYEEVASNKTIFFNTYITSKRNQCKEEQKILKREEKYVI